MNVIAVLSGECKQTGSRRGGKDKRGVRKHTDTLRVLRKSKVGKKDNDWWGIWLWIQQQSHSMQTRNMEAQISVKWCRWIIISWMDKNVLIE